METIFRFHPLGAAVTDHNKLTACSSSLSSLWCCGYSWSSAEMWQGWVGRWLFLAHRCRLRPPSTAAGLGQSGGYRGQTGEQMQQLSVRHSGCDQTGFNGLLSFSSSVLPAHGEPYQPPQLPGSARPSASILGALLPDPEEHAGRRRRHPVRTETLCTRTPALKRFSVFVAEPQLLRPLLVHTCSYTLHPPVITHTCRVWVGPCSHDFRRLTAAVFFFLQGAEEGGASQRSDGTRLQHRGRGGRRGDLHLLHPRRRTCWPQRRAEERRPTRLRT